MTQPYELLAIFPGTLTEEEVEKNVGNIQEVLTQFGATDVKAENMGKNRLSYPMKHIRYGYFYFFTFGVTKDTIGQVDKKLHLLPNLLRYVLRIHNPMSETPRMFADMEREESREMPQAEPERMPEVVQEVPKVEVKTPEATEEVEVKVKKTAAKVQNKEVSMEEIDEKLDDILDKTISSI